MDPIALKTSTQNILSNQIDLINLNIQSEIDYDEKLYDKTLAKIEFYYTQSGIEWSGLGIKLDVVV